MSHLFSPFAIGPLALPNRILIAPMCQYSAVDGSANDWHLMHLGHLALSGAALLIVEATAVSAEGRITPGDLGLYSDANEEALARVLRAIRAWSPIRVALQVAHAGRKASSHKPWNGGRQIRHGEPDAWDSVAPSAIAHEASDDAPTALDAAGLVRIRDQFAATAERAARLGFDGIELHAAHGYLLHEFLSPLANRRDDAYGGSLENRMRFVVEAFDAVRAVFPAERPVWVRLSGSDWVDGGWTVNDSIALSRVLVAHGCAAIHVSSGGVSPRQQVPRGAGYQVPLAERIKAAVDVPVIAVGLITEPEQAEAIVADGRADAVALARAMLYDPRWPWHAAAKLGAQVTAPEQYRRSQPRDEDLFVHAAADSR